MRGTLQFTARIAALAALLLAIVVVVVVVARGGDGEYELTAEFANASQLVRGNEVTVGGVPTGTVKRIELGDDGQALVTFSVSDAHAPLPAATTATVRSISLASVAGRRVELTPPVADTGPELPDGGVIDQSQTVSEVDLDEVLNTLDPATVADLKRVIEGLATSYDGVARQANRGFEYLNPLLSSARRVLGELGRDREALERLLVDGSQLSGALAERAPDISALIGNLDLAAGAIGRQRAALSSAVTKLPGFLRSANTTFVNLRAALNDLDPLVVATLPVARRLGPFFRDFRHAAHDAVPTIRDLEAIVRRRGRDNDLVELTRSAVPLAAAGVGDGSPDCGSGPGVGFESAADGEFSQGALGEATCAVTNSLPVIAHLRPYSPELVGWFDDFSTSGAIDANGGIARIAGTFNAFTASATNGLPDLLSPVDPDDFFGGAGPLVDVGNNSRCPGSNERDPGDGSIPFTDGGTLNCDPSQIAVGP